MFAGEVMSSPAITVRPATSLKEASQLLAQHNITAMPVVDGHGNLVGVLSEADVIQDAELSDPGRTSFRSSSRVDLALRAWRM